MSAMSAERISAAEKIWVIVNCLKLWQMSIRNLVFKWITMAEGSRKALKKKKAKELLNKLLKDADILNIYIEKIKKCGIAGANVAFTI